MLVTAYLLYNGPASLDTIAA